MQRPTLGLSKTPGSGSQDKPRRLSRSRLRCRWVTASERVSHAVGRETATPGCAPRPVSRLLAVEPLPGSFASEKDSPTSDAERELEPGALFRSKRLLRCPSVGRGQKQSPDPLADPQTAQWPGGDLADSTFAPREALGLLLLVLRK